MLTSSFKEIYPWGSSAFFLAWKFVRTDSASVVFGTANEPRECTIFLLQTRATGAFFDASSNNEIDTEEISNGEPGQRKGNTGWTE